MLGHAFRVVFEAGDASIREEARNRADAKEGIAAKLEKRLPNFVGE